MSNNRNSTGAEAPTGATSLLKKPLNKIEFPQDVIAPVIVSGLNVLADFDPALRNARAILPEACIVPLTGNGKPGFPSVAGLAHLTEEDSYCPGVSSGQSGPCLHDHHGRAGRRDEIRHHGGWLAPK